MKKSLLRAFLYSLFVFLILNLLFYIICYSLLGALDVTISEIRTHPALILYRLASPIRYLLWDLVYSISASTELAWIILFIGAIVSLTLAAIIAGIFGGSIPKSVGAWILTSLCSIGLLIAMFFIDSYTITWFCGGCTLYEAIVDILLISIVNILIFSGVALLFALLAGRSE